MTRLNFIDPKLGNYTVAALKKHYKSRKLYNGYKYRNYKYFLITMYNIKHVQQ